MSKCLAKFRRSRLSEALVVLAVVVAVMGIMPAALAHHPEITIGATCDVTGAIVVSGTSRAWSGCSGSSCGNQDVDIEIRWRTGGSWGPWAYLTQGQYTSGNGYQFSWGPVVWQAGANRVQARAHAVADWDNGTGGGQYTTSAEVYYPTGACDAYIRVDKVTIPATGNDPNFTFDPSWSTSDFTLDDNDTPYTSPALAPGSGYSVAEVSLPSGWQFDSATCSDGSPYTNISLSAGETVTCTFTNRPQPGRIIIDKVTVPAGDSQLFNFNPSWTADFQLADGSAVYDSGYTLTGSNYSISEDSVSGWSLTSANCDQGETIGDIDPQPGETVTCTFTNSKKGTIIIDKVTVPATGEDPNFTFDPDWGSNFTLDDNDPPASFQLSPGEYDVHEESIPSGWDLTSAVCDQGETVGDIDVAAGETVTCVFTNTQRGRIIVDKVTNPSTETDFGFEASWISRSGADFYLDDTDTPHDSGWLTPGNYDVYEVTPLPSGWVQTGASCSDGSPVSAISLQPGETVTCTFNNGPAVGHIIVDKVTIPAGDSQSFEFNPSWSGTNFFLTDTGTPVNTELLPGKYSVAELGVSGWDLTSAVCDHDETIGDIDVAAGETVTCVFTNTKLGRIRVDKTTDPAGDTTPFGINTTWAGEFNLRDLDVPYDSFWVLPPGTGFSVSEDAVPGWVLSSASCSGTVQGPIASLASFELKPGEQIDCVFNNYRLPTGKLTIIKDATPGDDTPFSFSGSVSTPVNGTLNGAARAATTLDPFVLRDPSAPSITLPQGPGAYVVTEGAVPAGWRFDDIVCIGTDAWSHVGQALSVTVGRDDAVACYFYNSGHGNIIVRKVVSPGDAPAQLFTFDPSWGPDFDLAGGQQEDSGLLPAGIHSVAELGGLPEGWSAGAASCNDGSSPAAIGLSPGETVTCTFNNIYREQEEEPEKAGLTIVKDAIPLVEPTTTLFGFSAGTLGTFQLGDGGSQPFEVDPGEYSVVETLPAGWVFAGVSCVDDSTGAAVPDGDLIRAVTVSLVADQHVTCTFLNRQERVAGPEGSLTVVKQTVPAGGTGFAFDAGALGTFTLDDGGTQLFTDLVAGAYSVTEIPSADWEFAQVECSALDYVIDGASVTVNLAEGEAAICTFTNGELPYTGSNPFTMPLLIGGLWALLMGLAFAVWSLMREADKA